MKLKTIWTLPAMDLSERLRRTYDWSMQALAARLPKRIKYWAFIQSGSSVMRNDVVPDARFMDLLARMDGGPR